MKLNIQKVQFIPDLTPEQQMLEGLEVLSRQNSGRMITATIRGGRQETEAVIRRGEPVYYEMLPLSLEEIFLAETEVQGYDAKQLIL